MPVSEKASESDERERRARAHTFAGGAACVIAVGAIPLFGWPAGIGMALVGVGNFVAARGVRTGGAPATPAWALMGLGVVVFVVGVVLLLLHGR